MPSLHYVSSTNSAMFLSLCVVHALFYLYLGIRSSSMLAIRSMVPSAAV